MCTVIVRDFSPIVFSSRGLKVNNDIFCVADQHTHKRLSTVQSVFMGVYVGYFWDSYSDNSDVYVIKITVYSNVCVCVCSCLSVAWTVYTADPVEVRMCVYDLSVYV